MSCCLCGRKIIKFSSSKILCSECFDWCEKKYSLLSNCIIKVFGPEHKVLFKYNGEYKYISEIEYIYSYKKEFDVLKNDFLRYLLNESTRLEEQIEEQETKLKECFQQLLVSVKNNRKKQSDEIQEGCIHVKSWLLWPRAACNRCIEQSR